MKNAMRSLLAEPRAFPTPPPRVWRDWVLVTALAASATLEAIFRPEVVWRQLVFVLTVVSLSTLLWRRTHPLSMLALVFSAVIGLDVYALIAGVPPPGLYTMAFLLILPYALFRWGSGHEMVIGAGFVVAVGALGIYADYTDLAEAVFGGMILVFPAVLGSSIRYRAASRFREIDQIKARERELLARELHDTVAHHVSAIAIRAQAGRAVAATDPSGATDALRIIETEASRTLAEMRRMVGVLRQDDEKVELAPQRGVFDIEGLASKTGDTPYVAVKLSGSLDDLDPAIGTAMYRLAQESVTNALRHAKHATNIEVTVDSADDHVRLKVSDNGESPGEDRTNPGYGLIGMAERATLLGGTLEAGPASGRGWDVIAILPKSRVVA